MFILNRLQCTYGLNDLNYFKWSRHIYHCLPCLHIILWFYIKLRVTFTLHLPLNGRLNVLYLFVLLQVLGELNSSRQQRQVFVSSWVSSSIVCTMLSYIYFHFPSLNYKGFFFLITFTHTLYMLYIIKSIYVKVYSLLFVSILPLCFCDRMIWDRIS